MFISKSKLSVKVSEKYLTIALIPIFFSADLGEAVVWFMLLPRSGTREA